MVNRTLSNQREKWLVLLTAVVLGAGLLFQFAVGPAVDRYLRMDKEIRAVEKKVGKYRQYEKNQKSPGTAQKEPQKLFKGFLEAFTAIETIARENNVEVLEIRPDTENATKTKSYKEVLANLKVRGSVESVAQFLYEVDRPSSNFRVERLSVSSKGGDANLEAALSISCFYLDD